jgi:hypothetical protein
MNINLLLTGGLIFILITSAGLTLVVSFFLLWLYRRAVLRGMGKLAGVLAPEPLAVGPSVAQPPALPALTITPLTPTSVLVTQNVAGWIDHTVTATLRRLALAYGLAGLVYALLFAIAWHGSPGMQIRPLGFLWTWGCYAWPVALAVSQVIALGWRERTGYAL